MVAELKRPGGKLRQAYGNLIVANTSRMILDSLKENDIASIINDFIVELDNPLAIFEKNGDYALISIAPFWCRILDEASRKLCDTDDDRKALEDGRWHCHESRWTEASKVAIETGEPIDVECAGGRRIYATPIFAGEGLVGAMAIGYGTPPTDARELQRLGRRYNVCVDMLRKHVGSCKPSSNYENDAAKRHLRTLAKLIGSIIERKKVEEALQESNEKFRAVFDKANDAIFWTDANTGFIINCNKAAETLLERKRREIIGHPHTIIHPPLKAEYYAKMFRACMEQQQSTFEAEAITRRGKMKMVHVTASVILVGGEPVIQGIFHDVTEQKSMEEELRHHREGLQELMEKRTGILRETERITAISEVAEVVGHDLSKSLQTMTNAILAAKQRINAAPPQYRNYGMKVGAWALFGKMEEEVEYIGRVASDLQDYARPLKPRPIEIRLDALIKESLSNLRVPPTVRISIQVEDLAKVTVDPQMMRRVLKNIVTNSVEAMPNGGEIVIRAAKKGDFICLDVQDTGVGVPDEILDKLFLPLFTTKPYGTGFGLPVCKRIVENHGGNITVQSKLNMGTTFTIRIPYGKRVRYN